MNGKDIFICSLMNLTHLFIREQMSNSLAIKQSPETIYKFNLLADHSCENNTSWTTCQINTFKCSITQPDLNFSTPTFESQPKYLLNEDLQHDITFCVS